MSSFYLLFVSLILITIIDGNEIFRAGKTGRSTENCPICRLHIHNTMGDLRNQAKDAIFQNDATSNLDANINTNHVDDDDAREHIWH